MGMGSVFASGVLGAVGGMGSAVYANAVEEQKQEVIRIREERLSKLRTQEHATNRASDMAALDAKESKERAGRADFYARTEKAAPGKEVTSTYTDQVGSAEEGAAAGGIIDSKRVPPSREELAKFRMEEAKKSGDEKLYAQAYKEYADIRAQSTEDRKSKAMESKGIIDERRVAVLEERAENDRKRTEDNSRRTDAMIAKALGGGSEKASPAKIREVRELADMAFGGDVQKAVSFVYGVQEKPRTAAVMQMAKLLREAGDDLADKPDQLMKKAEEMVDTLRAKEGATRGGVSVGGKPAPAAAAQSSELAKPTSQAEFDKIPRGARYVNPKDGLTYVKK